MSSYDVAALSNLIEQFERMPGIGHKSAQRMAFYVLNLPEEEAQRFARAITDAHTKIHQCKICCNLTEGDVCSICSNEARDQTVVRAVEDPRDVLAIERTHEYNGTYHVLHGAISPMGGVGPDQLTIKELLARLDGVQEVIMATNPTVEGEATYGVPVGADLEYADEVTLSRAMEGRRDI